MRSPSILRGREVVVGTLWPHEKSSTFRYASGYLAHPLAYPLDPALQLSSSATHTPPGKALPNAFSDTAPDRWGQNLGVDASTARTIVTEVELATRVWRRRAAELELPKNEIDLMAAAFETGQRRAARRLA